MVVVNDSAQNKFYLVKEFFVYTDNTFEIDSIEHLLTSDLNCAKEKFEELKELSYNYLVDRNLLDEVDIYEYDLSYSIVYNDNCDRKEISIIEFNTKDNINYNF